MPKIKKKSHLQKVKVKKVYDRDRKVFEKNSQCEGNIQKENGGETKKELWIMENANENIRKENNRQNMKNKRAENAVYYEQEKDRNKQRIKVMRMNTTYKQYERIENSQRMVKLRSREEYKQQEKVKNSQRMLEIRKDLEYKQQERLKNSQRMLEVREDTEFRQQERLKNSQRMLELREDEEYQQQEKQKNVQRIAETRKHEGYKNLENVRNLQRITDIRNTNEDFCILENEKNKNRMILIRANQEYKEVEKTKNAQRMMEKRKAEEYKQHEKEQNFQRMVKMRKDEEYKQQEKQINLQRMVKMRKDEEYMQQEKQKNLQRITHLRNTVKGFSQQEKEQNRKRIESIRSNLQYARTENVRNIERMKISREDEIMRIIERERDRQSRREKRSSEIIRHRDAIYNCLKRREMEPSATEVLMFINCRKEVPLFFCSCCERMFFEKGLKTITRDKVISLMAAKIDTENSSITCWVDSHVLNNYEQHGQNYLCHTCYKYVCAGKVPKLSSSNGLKLPQVPECLEELNPIEERIVSPFVPFIKILMLNHRASNPQIGAKGSVIYVPTDVNEMEQSLPRKINNTNIIAIPVEFKRHMGHASSYLKGLVRKEKLEAAGQYLQETELYKKYGIKFSENVDDILDLSDEETDYNLNDILEPETDIDEGEEVNDLLNEGDDDCLLIDLNEIAATNTVVVMAPGQNQKPVSPYSNPDVEYLCFPKIFAGKPRILTDKNITDNDIIKWEIRHYKNRTEPRRILHLSKKKLLNESYNSIKVAIRKKKNAKNVTAQQALQPSFIGGLLSFDNGLRFMDQMRCAPAYMQQKKKVLCAQIRQIGTPVFFLTVSAVETNWPELIQALIEYTTGAKVSLYDALNLTYEERAKLVKENPVFTAMYYDNKIKNLMKIITKPEGGVFETHVVTDFFRRREFQQRGSPHDHILLWVDNAPKLDPDDSSTFDSVIQFADKHVTCEYDEKNPFCKYLRHKHTPTCSKGKKYKNVCRFNFPKFVVPKTMILEPLPKIERTAKVKSDLAKIKQMMEQFFSSKERITKTFDEVLDDLQMLEHEYLTALKSSINKLTIFYKRRSCEVDINTYNTTILNLMESNVDLQLVVDEYAVAHYIVDYVAKGEAGLSKGLKDLQVELDKGDRNLQDRLRCIMNKFLNGHVISTSEAVYHCLGTPITEFSRSAIFINTGRSDDRVAFLRSTKQLQAMNPDSTDIVGKDILTHYSERKALDDVCLAEYAAYYFQTAKKTKRDKNLDSDNEGNETDTEKDDSENKRRRKARIVRHVRYTYEKDPDNFYREQLLLFLPWRNEEEEIESINWSVKFYENKELIERNRDNLFKLSSDRLDDAMLAAEQHRQIADAEEIEDFEKNQIPKEQEIDIFVQPTELWDSGGTKGTIVSIPDDKCNNGIHSQQSTGNRMQASVNLPRVTPTPNSDDDDDDDDIWHTLGAEQGSNMANHCSQARCCWCYCCHHPWGITSGQLRTNRARQ
nr:uncharacterized protein LOC115261217 [Aedes albopictus]